MAQWCALHEKYSISIAPNCYKKTEQYDFKLAGANEQRSGEWWQYRSIFGERPLHINRCHWQPDVCFLQEPIIPEVYLAESAKMLQCHPVLLFCLRRAQTEEGWEWWKPHVTRGHFNVLLVVIWAIPYQTKWKYRITTNDFIYCVGQSISPHPTR